MHYVRMCVYVRLCICVYVCICACVFICVYVCVCGPPVCYNCTLSIFETSSHCSHTHAGGKQTGLARTVYIYTVYDRICGDFPANRMVLTNPAKNKLSGSTDSFAPRPFFFFTCAQACVVCECHLCFSALIPRCLCIHTQAYVRDAQFPSVLMLSLLLHAGMRRVRVPSVLSAADVEEMEHMYTEALVRVCVCMCA